jgi:Listeria-Bacteroides repeat domain (List_Bact_rpt)./S-layer homology domain.
MRIGKRLISLLLLVAMIFTVIPFNALALADESDSAMQFSAENRIGLPFADVSAEDWFYDAIEYAYKNEIFSGTAVNSFDPYGVMTRSMFVTVMGRFAGIDPTEYFGTDSGFRDVAAGAYYAPYVAWAVEKEITGGVGDRYFDVDGSVTREQMAAFAERFFKAYHVFYLDDVVSEKTPSDLVDVSLWARDSVLNLYRAGILLGDENGHFNPKSTASRAEAAMVLKRIDTSLACRDIANLSAEDEKPVSEIGENNSGSGGSGSGSSGSGSGAGSYSIQFHTDGGSSFDSITVARGGSVEKLPTPIKQGAVFAGWFTDAGFTNAFHLSTAVTANLTLYARYMPVEIDYTNNMLEISSNYQIAEEHPVQPDLTIGITTSNTGLTAQDVLSMLQLASTSGVDDRSISVSGQNGSYIVSMEDGFKSGTSYTLTLPEDFRFTGKDETAREYSFSVHKEESDKLAFSDELIYISANEIASIYCNGDLVDSLSAAVFSVSEDGTEVINILGTFTYSGDENLDIGNILCVYSGSNPEQSAGGNASNALYDNIAYVKVTGVSGTTISYKSAEVEDVLFIAKTVAIQKSSVSSGFSETPQSFSFGVASLNAENTWSLGSSNPEPGEITVGDTIALYDASSLTTATQEDVILGTVTEISEDNGVYTIACKRTSVEQLQQQVDYYQNTSIDASDLISNGTIDTQMLQIELRQQTLQSGIVDELASQYAFMALEGDLLTNQVQRTDGMRVLMSDGTLASAAELQLLSAESSKKKVEVSSVSVNPTISSGGGVLGNGAVVATVAVSFDVTIHTKEDDVVKLSFSITFKQEISLSVNASAGIDWAWAFIFPYVEECWVSASLSVKTYSGIQLKAMLTTVSGDSENTIDISNKIKDAIGGTEEGEALENVSGIYAHYQKFMENDLDYIQIVKKSLFKTNLTLAWGLVRITVEPYFVVSAAANAAVTCELSYQEGTKYSFTARLSTAFLDFNKAPILNKQFNFSLYLVGRLGLRVGIELELKAGLISTAFNSMSVTAQAGMYLEWSGFFSYEYSRNFTQGTSTSVAQGAMYAELGAYLEVGVKFQLVNDKLQKSFGLVSETFPLLTTNSREYVYDFSYELEETEKLIINNSTALPDYVFKMIMLDLSSGKSTLRNYDSDRFHVSFTSPAFSLQNNRIVVNTQEDYLETDMIITWKGSPLAFTSVPIKRSFCVIYDNSETPTEKGLLTVNVNGEPVWSQRISFGITLAEAVPTQTEVLELIGYSDYDRTVGGNTVNLRYDSEGNYTSSILGTVNGSQEFNYVLPLKDYSVTVADIQNLNGSTTTQAFTTTYGESFNLSSLDSTGTEIPGDTYTRFFHVETRKDETAEGQPLFGGLREALALQILGGEGYTYHATYADNSATIIYRFQTIVGSIAGKTEIVKRGTLPVFDYTSYVESQPVGDTPESGNYRIYGLNGDVGTPVTGVRIVNITCVPAVGYDLTLNRNGGSYVEDYTPPISYDPSEGTPLPTGDKMIREHYAFAGWFEHADFSGNPVTTVIENQGPMTYYALWVAPSYTIQFYGAGEMDDIHTIVGEPITLLSRVQELEPFDSNQNYFTGWNTKIDGTGVTYENNATFTTPLGLNPSDNVLTLYAIYLDFTVTYSPSSPDAPVPSGTMALCSAMYYNEIAPGTITVQENMAFTYRTLALPDGTIFSGGGYELFNRGDTLFSIAEGNTVKIENMILRLGQEDEAGRKIVNEGNLVIEDLEISGSSNFSLIHNSESGKMLLRSVTIAGFSTLYAELLENHGTVVLDDCLIEGNLHGLISNMNRMVLNNVNFNSNGLSTYYEATISNVGGELYVLNTSVLNNDLYHFYNSSTGTYANYGAVESTGGTLYIVNSLLGGNQTAIGGEVLNIKIHSEDTAAYMYNSISGTIDGQSFEWLTQTNTEILDDSSIVRPGQYWGEWNLVIDDQRLKDFAATVHLDYSDLDDIKIGLRYDGTFRSILNGATTDTSTVNTYRGGDSRDSSDNRVGAEYVEIVD